MTAKNKSSKRKCAHEVPPVPSDDYPIIREEQEDGTVVYRHPVGSEIETGTIELDFLWACMHERYQSLIALLDPDDRQRFGIIFETLAAYNRRQMHEVLEFISRCIGDINVHYIDRPEEVYRCGRIVGISIKAKDKHEA